MEAGEYGLTRGTCFVARRSEVVAGAELLWIWWCVLVGADSVVISFFVFFFFFERTRPAASMRPPCLIYLSTSNINSSILIRRRFFRGSVLCYLACYVLYIIYVHENGDDAAITGKHH